MANTSSSAVYSPIKGAILPIAIAMYSPLFHYANNADIVLFRSFLEIALLYVIIACMIYVFISLLTRGKWLQSSLGTLIAFILLLSYGFLFDGLRAIDIFQIETYTLLPIIILLTAYIIQKVTLLSSSFSKIIWRITTGILSGLLLFNLVRILPSKIGMSPTTREVNIQTNIPALMENYDYPDIYFFIFDEAAGFEVAREYFGYTGIEEFTQFLKAKGFYIAEESHSSSTHTLLELAIRLNYENYSYGDDYFTEMNNAIADNKAMEYLKSLGYTLIAFDERRIPYPTGEPMPVDYLIEDAFDGEGFASLGLLDDYKMLVLQNSIFGQFICVVPNIRAHQNLISYTAKAIADNQYSSPKFVYVHLMLPHPPFAFKENGLIIPNQTEHHNWQRYLGNYKFSIKVMRELILSALSSSGPDNPPVIILQSDHGARNQSVQPYSNNLVNYPDEYKTWIVNSIYLPGCDDAPLSQDLDPINTFPIVFNCYFDSGIPLK